MTNLTAMKHTLFAITVVLATVIHFPALHCQQIRPYDTCGQSINCGDDEFGYPFWGSGRPQYCGHQGFQLACQTDVPVLRLDNVNYRVLDKDSSTQTITIARNDLWSNTCPRLLYNTTYNTTLFNGNNFGQESVSLFYGCQDNTLIPPPMPLADNFRFACDANGTGRNDSYFYRTAAIVSDIGNYLDQCNSSITVPVDGSRANIFNMSDLRSALQAGFKIQWRADDDDCNRCDLSNGRCGSNTTSPDVFTCYCASGNFSVTCDNISVDINGSGGDSKNSSLGIVLGIVGVVIVAVGVGCGIFGAVFLIREGSTVRVSPKGPKAADDKIEFFIRSYGTLAPKRYKYSEIKKMTNSFLEKLGRGGYGSVYKGQLPDGRLVAVKLLSEATGNGEDFINEVASISRTSHVNIVTLMGFCFEGKKSALLYEYMPNGSLDKFIRGEGSHLDWNTLFQIAKGIARGLEYLHRGCNTRIVHFDIKPHNILLDEEFIPKISDFGLAKLCKTKESIVSVTGARGTAGYMAPEVFFRNLGGASHKSDVYSYGMMVLEMTGARKRNNISRISTSEEYFPDWVYKQVEAGGTLGDNEVTTEEIDELARKMMIVSLWCIQTDPSDRPSISKVVEMLEGSFESLQVPPRRFASSPPRPLQGTSPSYMQSSSGEQVSTMQGKISLSNSHQTS